MSFDGTVTMFLRVVAPQTPCDNRWILRRPSHRITLPDEMDTRIEKKVMPLPKEPREGIFPRSEETDTVRNKDGVYEF